jgi:hypothetical protein
LTRHQQLQQHPDRRHKHIGKRHVGCHARRCCQPSLGMALYCEVPDRVQQQQLLGQACWPDWAAAAGARNVIRQRQMYAYASTYCMLPRMPRGCLSHIRDQHSTLDGGTAAKQDCLLTAEPAFLKVELAPLIAAAVPYTSHLNAIPCTAVTASQDTRQCAVARLAGASQVQLLAAMRTAQFLASLSTPSTLHTTCWLLQPPSIGAAPRSFILCSGSRIHAPHTLRHALAMSASGHRPQLLPWKHVQRSGSVMTDPCWQNCLRRHFGPADLAMLSGLLPMEEDLGHNRTPEIDNVKLWELQVSAQPVPCQGRDPDIKTDRFV